MVYPILNFWLYPCQKVPTLDKIPSSAPANNIYFGLNSKQNICQCNECKPILIYSCLSFAKYQK